MSNTGSFNADLTSIDEIVIVKANIENATELVRFADDEYRFDITFQFHPGVNLDLKKVRMIFTCDIKTHKSDRTTVPINGHFDIAFIFTVENLSELVLVLPDDIEIDDGLMASIGNVVYSTSRGIIYSRCLGTILKKVILPVLSTEKILKILVPEKSE